jgi:hypothetical protein
VTRTFGSVVFPGSGAVGIQNPFSVTNPAFPIQLGRTVSGVTPGQPNFNHGGGRNIGVGRGGHRQNTVVVPYAYPVYVGGYYDNAVQPEVAPPPVQQQPNVVVVYPQAPAPAPIYMAPTPDQGEARATPYYYTAPQTPQSAAEPQSSIEQPHYILAFKDHTIYSAIAYWVDGDTLHYFTAGNTHNQASLSLVDRDLTERLNKDSGVEVKLPAPK